MPGISSHLTPHHSDNGSCNDEGFSLMEVIIALTIFAAVIAFAGQATASLLAAVREHDARSKASGLLASSIAEAQAVPASTLPLGTAQFQRTIDNHTYTVKRTIAAVPDTSSSASLCKGDSFSVDNRSVSVTISWQGARGPRSIQGSSWAQQLTALKPPSTTSATTGNASLLVKDENGDPVPGATAVVNPGNLTVTTDAHGCLVLPQLAADPFGTNYTISITKPGYVSNTNRPTVITHVAITRGNTAKASPVVLGKAITVRMKGSFDGSSPWDSTPGQGGLVYVATVAEPRPQLVPLCNSVPAGTPCTTGFTGEIRNIYPGSTTLSGDRCFVKKPEINYPTVNNLTPTSTEALTTALRVRVRLRPDWLGKQPKDAQNGVVRVWYNCLGNGGVQYIDYPTNGADEITIAVPLTAGLVWSWPIEWRTQNQRVSLLATVTGSNTNRDLSITLYKRPFV